MAVHCLVYCYDNQLLNDLIVRAHKLLGERKIEKAFTHI